MAGLGRIVNQLLAIVTQRFNLYLEWVTGQGLCL